MDHETASADGAPSGPLVAIVRAIDGLSLWSGRLFCWLVVPLVVGLTYEVFARYVFHAPTIWAYDVAYMLYGSHFMLGAAYTLYRGGHIRTDIFYQNWSVRTRGWSTRSSICSCFFRGSPCSSGWGSRRRCNRGTSARCRTPALAADHLSV